LNQDSTPDTDAISRLVQEFSKLPGIGPKSAQRITFHLLRSSDEKARDLAAALEALKEKVTLCSVCCNVTESDPCPICRNSRRDTTQVCIVEQPQDILALEHTGIYKGLYHVLHGAISPSEGIGTDDIRIRELLERLQNNTIQEVILATNTNLEGEQTAMYLSRLITPLNIKVTRLARGLPYGTELEYADDVTLTRALKGRSEF
jgi:recombination protein RecR